MSEEKVSRRKYLGAVWGLAAATAIGWGVTGYLATKSTAPAVEKSVVVTKTVTVTEAVTTPITVTPTVAIKGCEERGFKTAPGFTIKTLDGRSVKLADFRGKPVILDFMATWCGPCRIELKHLEEVWRTHAEAIAILSIDVDPRESEEEIREFLEDHPGATWIWARDTANLSRLYEVTRIPTLVIIDREGCLRFRHVGVTGSSTLIQELSLLLREGSSCCFP